MEDYERAALRFTSDGRAGKKKKAICDIESAGTESDMRHRVGWDFNLNARADAVTFEKHEFRHAAQETPRSALFSALIARSRTRGRKQS